MALHGDMRLDDSIILQIGLANLKQFTATFDILKVILYSIVLMTKYRVILVHFRNQKISLGLCQSVKFN